MMAAKTRFGIFLPQVYPWEQMKQTAAQIEALGFDSLWVADHFVSPYSATADWFECWSLLGALAASTEHLRLGTGVTHVVYRNPAILARAALTVDHISNGRLDFGFGVGSGGDYNYAMTGTPAQSKRARVDRYREAVVLIDQLLRQELTSYAGEYFGVQEAPMHPRPVQQPRPPFNLAAHYPRSLRIAAEYGDAWNSFYPGDDLTPEQSSAVTRQRGEMLAEFAQEAGRDPDQIRRTFFVGYSSDHPFASVEAFRDFIGRYQEAGIDEFVLGYAPGVAELAGDWMTAPEELERYAQEIIPALNT
jgi:alkanesulfonate monooxygenase SsuD/methylene tetrahydromethanopterin reductase-like flavin-dependent oxidoreductase (luciferase family)